MTTKKQARELPHITGINQYSTKDTKRNRIIQYELVRKWKNPTDVQMSQKEILWTL